MLNGAIAHTNSILPALNEVKYFYLLSLSLIELKDGLGNLPFVFCY